MLADSVESSDDLLGESFDPMTQQSSNEWLEAGDGSTFEIHGNFSIGRASSNSIRLAAREVSRRHATIHPQNIGEIWLIDLGSSNGTFVNKRRIHQPIRLRDQDVIMIGEHQFVFHQSEKTSDAYGTTAAARTMRSIARIACWLLVADIEDFTPLSQSLESEKLATLVGGWISNCQEIVSEHEGMIDKYLGDGFLAYWRHTAHAPDQIAAAIEKLNKIQLGRNPPFRVVIHYGTIAIGGVPSLGEESLLGKDVNFVFRLEKLAGSLGVELGMSEAAVTMLQSRFKTSLVGEFELKGFEGRHRFFSVC